MNKNLTEQLDALNCQYKLFDMIYHKLAVKFGISDSELIILYEVYTMKNPPTQKDLCSIYSMSKQTINSAIKKLKNNNYITLESFKNTKNKNIILTNIGREFCNKTIAKVIEIEKSSLECLTKKQRESLITITDLYLNTLNSNVDKFIQI